ncbi:glycoside hydrolase family 88/105 protein [Wenjunlia tyrosinilytica]|uniref:Unsaturated rhamnogalacturonyl hydrolase n=1 Tax=Wenjunlia tyrosinilytica TaxID=1544741 RepID=A0A917ZSW2_9ACTN|nr:glycoside hydrolase family 88 protein [Wenjunlia tyrosinilytica]GGO90975.1 hypothetical protein GCM10012280_37750 [Wenjunlia tyrosinilytica]
MTSTPSRREFARTAALVTGGALVAGSGLGRPALAGTGPAVAAGPDPWERAPATLDRIRAPRFPDRVFSVLVCAAEGDGVDPDSTTDAPVVDSGFNTHDDRVVIESGRDADGRRVGIPTTHVAVERRGLSGRWSGITVGSGMSGGILDIFARDRLVNAPDRPGRYPSSTPCAATTPCRGTPAPTSTRSESSDKQSEEKGRTHMSSPSETSRPARRSVVLGAAGALGALSLPSAAAIAASVTPRTPPPGAVAGARAAATDWSKAVVDSTLERHPTPADLGGWGYTTGLYLYGQYLVHKRLGNRAYLDYIVGWANRFVKSDGSISNSFGNLDSMRSGQLLPLLHKETGDPRYKKAADKLRKRFNQKPDPDYYPRTSDGGMWHATGRTGQLWADGVYMAQPFLALYGRTYNDVDSAYEYEESARNLAVYFQHLRASNGLLYHAYDEDGSESWSSGTGHHSKYHWARAIGWFGMACVDILEVLPAGHPRRPQLIGFVRHLAKGYARHQSSSGRWYQVVDKGSDSRNWQETSASAMYTFMVSRAVQRGYVDAATYQGVADRGYAGVLGKVSLGSDGLTNIEDISEGTNVGDLAYYYGRKRNTNDFHGLGAFLIMNEQLAHPR